MGGKYAQNKMKKKPGRKLCIMASLLLLLAAAGVGGWLYLGSRRIPEKTTLSGLELGGMTCREAKAMLTAAAEEGFLTKELRLVLPEETLVFSPQEAGIKFHIDAALKDALQSHRWATGAEHPWGLSAYLTMEEGCFQKALGEYAQRHDSVLRQSTWALEGAEPEWRTDRFDPQTPCQSVTITLGVPEQHLNQKEAMEKIYDFYDQALEPGKVFEIQMEVTPEAVPENLDLEEIYERCCRPTVDDSLDMTSYQMVPGAYGCAFDLERGKKELGQAAWGESVTLPMTYVEPEILGEEIYFRDVLGTCETKHNNDENRNTNLRLICEILNDHVVEPGEEFSYNAVVGERTKERGFLPAPVYSGTTLVQGYGGGACQTSTTLYNCLLLADMEITARSGHGAVVSYVPRGLDAAVNWSTNTDLAFRNNSHFPVKIQAKVEDGYVKMELLGTDEKDYYIKMESGSSEDSTAIYAVSYKCKYDKETGERISRERETTSTYLKNLG